MSYAFQRKEPVPAGIRRIAGEQVRSALEEIDDPNADRHQVIHQVRKRVKRLRALLRLVRSELGETYARENEALRDSARRLTSLRDAESISEACERLREGARKQDDRELLGRLHEALTERRERLARGEFDLEGQLQAFRASMLEVGERSLNWPLERQEFPAIREGLRRVYRAGRDELQAASRTLTAEALHEWRKRVKDHWHHTQLLTGIWKGPLREHARQLKLLADSLGDHHDLAVLSELLREGLPEFSGAEDRDRALVLVAARGRKLEREAFPLGQRLFAESPRCLLKRYAVYWQAWRGR